MQRRAFLKAAMSATTVPTGAVCGAFRRNPGHDCRSSEARRPRNQAHGARPDDSACDRRGGGDSRVKELGFPTAFFRSMATWQVQRIPCTRIGGLLDKYGVTATRVEVVGPGGGMGFSRGARDDWAGASAKTRSEDRCAKADSDFAKQLGIGQVQTHCGFIPENPGDPLYARGGGRDSRQSPSTARGTARTFLMETGQETPTTMSRAIRDVDHAESRRGSRYRKPDFVWQGESGGCGGYYGAACAERSCERWQLADESG